MRQNIERLAFQEYETRKVNDYLDWQFPLDLIAHTVDAMSQVLNEVQRLRLYKWEQKRRWIHYKKQLIKRGEIFMYYIEEPEY